MRAPIRMRKSEPHLTIQDTGLNNFSNRDTHHWTKPNSGKAVHHSLACLIKNRLALLSRAPQPIASIRSVDLGHVENT